MRRKGALLRWVLAACCFAPLPGMAANFFMEDEPPYLSLGIGTSGVFDPHQDPCVSIEYRPAFRFYKIGPWVYFKRGKDDDSYVAGGIFTTLALGERWAFTPKFGPGYYDKGDGTDLGSELEFRSEFEISYRFENEHRVGLGLAHLSNAGTANWNPGTEVVTLSWAIPLGEGRRSQE